MADDIAAGLKKLVAEVVEDRIKKLEEQVEDLAAKDEERGSELRDLAEKLEKLEGEVEERDGKPGPVGDLSNFVQKEELKQLADGSDKAMQRAEALAGQLGEALDQLKKISAEVQQLSSKVASNQVNPQQITALNTRLNVVQTQTQQVTAQASQIQAQVVQANAAQQQLRQLLDQTAAQVKQNDAQGAMSMCQALQQRLMSCASQEQVNLTFSQFDRSLGQLRLQSAWQDVDLDNTEAFDPARTYRMSSGDGWMYSTTVQPNHIYMISNLGNDDIVVMFSQNKRLPMARRVGAPIGSMQAHPSGSLQSMGAR